MADDLRRAALDAIDRLLADRPDKVGHDFSEATRGLSAWRDTLIMRLRETYGEADRRNLERANAALSVIVGGQFPLGNVAWPEIERLRNHIVEW